MHAEESTAASPREQAERRAADSSAREDPGADRAQAGREVVSRSYGDAPAVSERLSDVMIKIRVTYGKAEFDIGVGSGSAEDIAALTEDVSGIVEFCREAQNRSPHQV